MALPIDQIVSVTVLTSAIPPAVPGFGSMMFMGRSTTLTLQSRVLIAAQQSDVSGAGFSTTSEEYLAAGVYFAQVPKPIGPFKVGRQFLTAQSGLLLSGGVTQTLATWQAITNGGFDITVNATLIQVTALNLSGAASMAAIATLLQTKLAAGLASTTCVFANGQFVITSPTTGPTSLVGYAVAPTGGGAPVDVSALFQFTTTTGARAVNGIAIETMTASLVATRLLDSGWYGLAIPQQNTVQDNKDCMLHAQSTGYKFWCSSPDVTMYDPNVSTDLASYAQTNSYNHTFVIYSSSPYAAVSAAAREQSTDITAPSSFGTLMFKKLPGIAVENLTTTQVAALKAKNANYYIARGAGAGFAELENGIMANGQFSDEVFGLDAFAATYQNAIYTALATPATKVPQTDKGGTQLLQAGAIACEQFVRNGFFAPGVWASGNIASVVNTGDFLKLGYIQYIGPIAQQSVSDRALRKTPPITVVGKGAGAFHSAAVTFIFDR